MADKTIKTRIINKHDTSTNWSKAVNFIPKKGEIIIYDDLRKMKIGDGTTVVSSLPFVDAALQSNLDKEASMRENADSVLQANIDKKQDILTAGTSILISADKVSLKDEAQGTSIGVAVLTQSEFESQKSAGTLKKDVIYFVLEGGN